MTCELTRLRAHPPFTLERCTHKKSSFAMWRETHPLSLGPLLLLFPLVQLQVLLSHSFPFPQTGLSPCRDLQFCPPFLSHEPILTGSQVPE